MTLRIYRIDRSFFGKLNNRFKAPDLPVSQAFGSPFKNLADFNRENSYVLSKDDEIDRFNEAYDDDWVDDRYYIRHPKKSKTDCLIPSASFHKYVVREQIADIVSYVRSNLRVKEMQISVSRGNSGKVGLNGVVDGLPLEGEATIEFGDKYSASIKCKRPLKASEKKSNYIWIQEFPHLVASVDNAESGVFEINEEFDLSFGLAAKAAKSIGASASWNTKHRFNFKVVVD